MTQNKKPLPKVELPSLSGILPISKKKIKYRPFIVKEQKSLLLAQASEDQDSVFETICDIIHSCTSGTVDVKETPFGDISWLFLKIANASVGPEHAINFTCENSECGREFVLNLNLDDVQMKNPEYDPKILISDDVGVKLKNPTFIDLIEIEKMVDDTVQVIYYLIDYVFDSEQVYSKDEYTIEEFRDWMESFSDEQLLKFDQLINNMPDISHTYEFDCPSCGKKHRKLVEGLLAFFRIKSGQF